MSLSSSRSPKSSPRGYVVPNSSRNQEHERPHPLLIGPLTATVVLNSGKAEALGAVHDPHQTILHHVGSHFAIAARQPSSPIGAASWCRSTGNTPPLACSPGRPSPGTRSLRALGDDAVARGNQIRIPHLLDPGGPSEAIAGGRTVAGWHPSVLVAVTGSAAASEPEIDLRNARKPEKRRYPLPGPQFMRSPGWNDCCRTPNQSRGENPKPKTRSEYSAATQSMAEQGQTPPRMTTGTDNVAQRAGPSALQHVHLHRSNLIEIAGKRPKLHRRPPFGTIEQ